MLFRETSVDKVTVLNCTSPRKLEESIKVLGERYIFVDLQFSVNSKNKVTWFSALALLREIPKGVDLRPGS